MVGTTKTKVTHSLGVYNRKNAEINHNEIASSLVRLKLCFAWCNRVLHRVEDAEQAVTLLLLAEVIRNHVIILRHEGPPLP